MSKIETVKKRLKQINKEDDYNENNVPPAQPQTESCASCLSFQLFQLGSTTSCSVLTSPNKDETGLSALAC